jgi:hypothetical protein
VSGRTVAGKAEISNSLFSTKESVEEYSSRKSRKIKKINL